MILPVVDINNRTLKRANTITAKEFARRKSPGYFTRQQAVETHAHRGFPKPSLISVESLLIDILEAIRENGVPRQYLREDAAAIYLGQTPFFVGELIRSGRIHAIKPPGAKYRVLDIRDLEAFMAAQKAAEPVAEATAFKATA